jgi:hypothetical protein
MKNHLKQIGVFAWVCSLGLAAQAQLIDPLTGSLAGYTDTTILDNSLGAGNGVSFTSSASGLQANYVGTGTTAEQALFLAPVSSFSTVFAVGDRLTVNVAMPVSAIQIDFGLAVAATATPTAASAGNSWNSRPLTDFASIYVRPSQTAVRGTTSISGTVTTGFTPLTAAANTVSQLFIDWVSTDVFTLGYVDTSAVAHNWQTVTFAGASTIGTAIGFYGDLRATGTSLSYLNNLTIAPIPEPTSTALCGLGTVLGLASWLRRKNR